jgi:hypothetical protein
MGLLNAIMSDRRPRGDPNSITGREDRGLARREHNGGKSLVIASG